MLGAAPVEVAAKPVVKPTAKPVPKPPVSKPKPPVKAGAEFAETPATGGDRFVEETEATAKPHWSTPPVKPTAKPPASAPVSPAFVYYVQVAAFGNEASARALAKQIGGVVTPAGKIFRVQKGPYASDALARTALGQVKAKGYRDARVTR